MRSLQINPILNQPTESVRVRLLPNQEKFRKCQAKWAAARGGKGSGKTTAIAWWLIQRMLEYPQASHYIAGATFPQLREGSFNTVSGILESVLGWTRGKDFSFRDKSQSPVITFNDSGATLTSITAEQQDKINSLEFQTLVCEEPQTWEHGEESFLTMVTRLRPSQAVSKLYPDLVPSGRMSFNPPTQAHWLYDLIERRWPKLDYPCFQFSLRENYMMANLGEYISTLQGQLPEYMWPSEIDGEWRTASDTFFPLPDLQEALNFTEPAAELRTLRKDDYGCLAHGELYIDDIPWHNRFPESRYVHFWDLADKQDWTVGITIDATFGDRMTVVEFERFNQTGWKHIYERIRERHHRYQVGRVDSEMNSSGSKTFIDSTGVGDAAVDELVDIGVEGFKFTATSKPEILARLQSALSKHELKYPLIPVLFDELKLYERDDKNLVQDCVMALAGAVNYAKRKSSPNFSFFF